MPKIYFKLSIIVIILISFSSIFWYVDLNNYSLLKEIIYLRVPRLAASILVGSILAICGCLIQNITHNPLAEPSILGISSSSSLFSVIFIMLGFSPVIGGVIGALLGLLVLSNFSQSKNNFSLYTLLKGLMLTTITGAAITLCLQLSSGDKIPQLLFWLMGDFSYIDFNTLIYLSLSFFILVVFIYRFKDKLNYLWLDKNKSYTLGIDLNSLHKKIFLLIGISIGIITSQVGNISFIGLISPYIARYIINLLIIRNNLMNNIILSGLIGGIILNISDITAKYIIYPSQISIGVITAFIGVPLFWKILYAVNKKS